MAGGAFATEASPARRCAVLPHQASCPGATDGSSSAVRAPPFPQPVWTTWRRTTSACAVPAAAVCPGSGAGLPSPGLPAAGDALVADGCSVRLSSVPGTPSRTAVNGPVSTALRRQGRLVARAAGPRHHRPRLRHRTHRRGPASAASRPTQSSRTHGRIGIPVCTAVGGPVRAAAEAASPLDCPRGLLGSQTTYWFPVGVATRSHSRCALPVPRMPATPQPPPGDSTDRIRSCRFGGCTASVTGPLRPFSPSCKRLECTAVRPLRQGLAARGAPAGPPPSSGCQRGQDGVSGGPRCWRTMVAGPGV